MEKQVTVMTVKQRQNTGKSWWKQGLDFTLPGLSHSHTHTHTLKSSLVDHPNHFSDHFYYSSEALFLSKAPHTARLPDQTVTAVLRRPPPVFLPSCWDAGSSALLTVPAGCIQQHSRQWDLTRDEGRQTCSSHRFTRIHPMCLRTFYVIIMQLKEWKVTFNIHQCE